MKQKLLWVLYALVIVIPLAGAIFFAAPYYALYALRDAAQTRNAEKFSSYIDFPSVKASLSASLSDTLSRQVEKEAAGRSPNSGYGALGALLGAVITKPIASGLVDAMVTPDNIARMFNGLGPAMPTGKADAQKQPNLMPKLINEYGYETLDIFTLTVKREDRPEQAVQLVMRRTGLLSWKLTSVELPERS
jgi:Protein of unknown function (DUF2939)